MAELTGTAVEKNREFKATIGKSTELQGTATKTGPRGPAGVSPVVSIESIEGGHNVTITDAEGEKSFDVMDGVNGSDGTSVTVSNVSESTADGGSNVVTFSDGTTMTIKNGSDGVSVTHEWTGTTLIVTSASGTTSADLKGETGETGDTGKTAYAYAQDGGYEGTEDEFAKKMAVNDNILIPDYYDGTDSEKLQACFDALETSGGVISLNREYKLTDHIFISHNSNDNDMIIVRGISPDAGIDFDAYSIKGADETKAVCGGLIFDGLRLSTDITDVTTIAFDFSHLIRVTLTNCMIRNFTHLAWSNNYIQTLYLMGCYIRKSSVFPSEASITASANADDGSGATVGAIMDFKMIGCVAESGVCLIDVPSASGCTINGNCIEGYSDIPIKIGTGGSISAFDISNNYFESNGGTNIDLHSAVDIASVNISSNMFCEYKDDDENAGIILLPPYLSNGYINIANNKANNDNVVLLRILESAQYSTERIYAFANVGTVSVPNGCELPTITPANIHKAVKGLVKGTDYWTEADKAEMVEEVFEAMSGETWVFEMRDGTTVERVVATANLTQFDSESWSFVLADGTKVEKVVSLV